MEKQFRYESIFYCYFMRSHFVRTVIEGSSRVIWMERALGRGRGTGACRRGILVARRWSLCPSCTSKPGRIRNFEGILWTHGRRLDQRITLFDRGNRKGRSNRCWQPNWVFPRTSFGSGGGTPCRRRVRRWDLVPSPPWRLLGWSDLLYLLQWWGTEVAGVLVVFCGGVEVEDDDVAFEGFGHFLHHLAVGRLG